MNHDLWVLTTYCASHGVGLPLLIAVALAGFVIGVSIRGLDSTRPVFLLLISVTNFAAFQALVATVEATQSHHTDVNTAQLVTIGLFALWSLCGVVGLKVRHAIEIRRGRSRQPLVAVLAQVAPPYTSTNASTNASTDHQPTA